MTPYDHVPPGPAPSAEPASNAPHPVHKRSGSQKRQRNKFWVTALTEEEEARVMESAARVGLSRSSYGRVALLGTPGPRARRKPHVNAVELGKAVAALNRSGNVLNQMQHSLNAGNAITLGRECSEALAANRRAADAILEAVGRKERDDDYQGHPA
jgi:hypothetical protein